MAAPNVVSRNWVLTEFAGRYYSDNEAPLNPGEVLVEWDPVTPLGSATLVGYKVYWVTPNPGETDIYSQAIGSGEAVAAGTEFYLATGLTPATEYWFAVTTIDSDGYESEYLRLGSKVVA